MSEKIEPALSADEWSRRGMELVPHVKEEYERVRGVVEMYFRDVALGRTRTELIHVAIALLNGALAPDDPRKLTHDKIALLRDDRHRETEAAAFIDALEAYLPPQAEAVHIRFTHDETVRPLTPL